MIADNHGAAAKPWLRRCFFTCAEIRFTEVVIRKPHIIGGASVREQKAAALDAFVKQETEKRLAAEAVKTARLKALRLARDAAENSAASDAEPAAEDTKPAAQKDETPK